MYFRNRRALSLLKRIRRAVTRRRRRQRTEARNATNLSSIRPRYLIAKRRSVKAASAH